MYGLTCDPQDLHTTNRSGVPAIQTDNRPLLRSRGDDLRHHLAEVVVGLVDDALAARPVAALQQVVDAVELGRRPEVLGVGPQAVDEAARQLLRAHLLGRRQVEEGAVETLPRGAP